jgi:IS30 family transposase
LSGDLPAGRDAQAVYECLIELTTDLPDALRRSLTWDSQDREMAKWTELQVDADIEVFFCDPHSLPLTGQRGSNENTNGLLRQYMPKSTDLSKHSAEDLMRNQRSLDERPRKTLDYTMPSEKLAEIVTLTP